MADIQFNPINARYITTNGDDYFILRRQREIISICPLCAEVKQIDISGWSIIESKYSIFQKSGLILRGSHEYIDIQGLSKIIHSYLSNNPDAIAYINSLYSRSIPNHPHVNLAPLKQRFEVFKQSQVWRSVDYSQLPQIIKNDHYNIIFSEMIYFANSQELFSKKFGVLETLGFYTTSDPLAYEQALLYNHLPI